MNTGFPRHFTVIAWPTAIGFTFTSMVERASVSAAGLRLLMKGQAVAIAPTAAMAPVATMRKSRRVGSPWALAGMLPEEAIACYIPRGVKAYSRKSALSFKALIGRTRLEKRWPHSARIRCDSLSQKLLSRRGH